MFGRTKPQLIRIDASYVDRLNHLENRIDKLELEAADRQLTVLKTVEKVLYQLRARDAGRKKAAQEHAQDTIDDEPVSEYPPPPQFQPTVHLARRFRGG